MERELVVSHVKAGGKHLIVRHIVVYWASDFGNILINLMENGNI